ncbi:MAG TPA: chemotaxis protein CheB [Polyangiaceae bacterium]
MSKRTEAIVIGGSTGALEALQTLLPALSGALGVSIAIVLHLMPDKPSALSAVLAWKTGLPVKEADDKEPLVAGHVYVAPPNYHLLVEKDRRFSLSVDAPVHFSRPAIDVLFESAADVFGPALVGVLLSGANEDGARGLARIRAAGGTTVVQTPASSAAPQMPEAALRLGGVDYVTPLVELGPLLARLAAGDPAGSPPATKERG